MLFPHHKAAVMVGVLLISCSAAVADEAVSRKVTREDMPRIPSTEPADALATFKLAKGFKLEMVAHEPLVSDPVDACFDEFGRMFVAEMHGYPFSQEPNRLNPKGGGKKDAGIIRMLEDTDNDGVMDKSVVFADNFSWPTSVCCYNGGIFVLAPQYLYYFKDTDGDGKADVREVVLDGFGRGNVQAVTNGLQWSLDNHVYFAVASNPADLKLRGEPLFSVRGSDLRFDPKTEKFEQVTGGVQFGHTRDNWDTRFVCSNSNHMQQIIYPRGYLSRNPYYAASGMIRSVAEDGASAPVFRRSPPEPWRIIRQKWRAADKGYKLVVKDDGAWEFLPLDPSKKAGAVPTEYPVGFFTSATGITIYRGNAYPEEFQGDAYVGDVGGNLVHRKKVNSEKVTYSAVRADQGEEIVASSDNWFRPVNFVNAPDGCLYILDMYRETIEHPHSIPEEIKQFLDLTSGHDRGRIYRLVSPNVKRITPKKLGNMNTTELVKELASDNAWNRDTAQRLLWERQDKTSVAPTRELLTTSKKPLGRLHALCTLDGLDALTAEDIKIGLKDSNPRVKAHAVRLSEPFLRKSDDAVKWLAPLVDDPSEHVRFQLAFSLGESSADAAVDLLAKLAKDSNNGANVLTAVYSSVGNSADKLMTRLTSDPAALKQRHVAAVVSQLGLIIGANPDVGPSLSLLQTATAKSQSLAASQKIVTALGEGLSRRGGTIATVLKDSKATDDLRSDVADLFSGAADVATNEDAPAVDRLSAVNLLAYADLDVATDSLPELLSSQTPQSLQLAAVRALSNHDADGVADSMLSEWRSFSPKVRAAVVESLTGTNRGTTTLLAAVEDGAVKRGDIERAIKQQLMSHRDKKIAAHSKTLFGSEVETNRSKVVADFQDLLQLEGNAERGVEVFKKICAQCHKVGDMGHQVAPDLASVKNKSEADLLIAILDPNREAQPTFNTYTVVTNQGRTYNGIIASESSNSITLRKAEANEDVILRSNIEDLVSTGISLMPEGLEKDLSKQQIADVIAFVKSVGSENAKTNGKN
ncbi:PVC-type heme-binding CxxCH protein [Fuerstiella marisgermanici]|uniref:Putative membrane-bound dehydrogenase domain protein n=1 Tax=Fuerstiella marisgermanici TaxID=1891926 RepID=A0A1P8WB03_9PLAN|nr:PVC-type heme-binding CxxCH protein [Fuerstiella marisgermanici]APZ91242.1 putative membrane-bound dehydrogenase domain protein [Fuerstiella marisgermanici]